jgi:hypothetical protein
MGGHLFRSMYWKYGKASVAGTSHALLNTPCQDAHVCKFIQIDDKEVIVAVVCDGAGSASKSDVGAQTMSEIFANQAETYLIENNSVEGLNREMLFDWVINARQQIIDISENEGFALREYSCTFLAAIVGGGLSFFLQIGDGCMVVSEMEEPDAYKWIFWPQKGLYFNTTNFVTDTDFMESLQFDKWDKMPRDMALFSDGIESIALKFDSEVAYSPFFKGLFGALRSKQNNEPFDREIAQFLNSDKVNERTDDDKTLIIASLFDES